MVFATGESPCCEVVKFFWIFKIFQWSQKCFGTSLVLSSFHSLIILFFQTHNVFHLFSFFYDLKTIFGECLFFLNFNLKTFCCSITNSSLYNSNSVAILSWRFKLNFSYFKPLERKFQYVTEPDTDEKQSTFSNFLHLRNITLTILIATPVFLFFLKFRQDDINVLINCQSPT